MPALPITGAAVLRNRLVLCVNSILLPPYDFPLFFLPICILLCRICGFCDILSNAMRYLRNFSEFVIWYYCYEQENHLFNSQNQWQSSLICRISFDGRASQGTEQLCNISHKHRYMEGIADHALSLKRKQIRDCFTAIRIFYCCLMQRGQCIQHPFITSAVMP